MTSFEEVAAELYRLSPTEFTAERNARAKDLRAEDPDLAKQVAGLPKPALPAWALNNYAHEHAAQLADLLDLGAELREAQEQLSRDRLRELTAQATPVVQALVRDIAEVAERGGSALSDAARQQVEQTLRAAMSDADASDAVRAGLLTKPLAPGGFGAVDLAGAVAGAPPHVAARPRPARAKEAPDDGRRRRMERDLRAAEQAEEKARSALQAREEERAAAEDAHAAAERDVTDLRDALRAAEQRNAAASLDVRAARQAAEKAAKHLEAARRRTEEVRRKL